MRTWVQTITGSVLRFFFPWACAGCRTPLESLEDSGFCGRCWLAIPRIEGCVCRFCGVPLKDGGNLCFPCRETPLKIPVRSAVRFAGPVQSAIHRFKYSGRKSLVSSFQLLMSYAWEHYPELQPVDMLVPVPLHPASQRTRGYNQAGLLAETLARTIQKPVWPVLVRTRRTPPQAHLRKTQRLTNLQNAFALSAGTPSLKGLHVLLIDDVCTTGATLVECARVLKGRGASQVKALVLARDI
jgi:competence protein ComFC